MQQLHAPEPNGFESSRQNSPLGDLDRMPITAEDMEAGPSFEVLPKYTDRKQFITDMNGEPWTFVAMAKDRKMSTFALMDLLSPPGYGDYMPAFERVAFERGLLFRSDHAAGYSATPIKHFMNGDPVNYILMQEYINGIHRYIAHRPVPKATPKTQFAISALQSADDAAGSLLRPWYDSMMLKYSQLLERHIPLSLLTAMTEMITGADYRAFEFILERGDRKPAVAEGADLPVVRSQHRENYVSLHKRGLAVRITDETQRRLVSIDRLGFEFAKAMINDEIAKVYEAIGVILNGDGNTDTKAVQIDPFTLDPNGDFKNTGAPTLDMWFNWKQYYTFEAPYMMGVLLGASTRLTEILKLPVGASNAVFLSSDYTGNPNVDNFMPVPPHSGTINYANISVDDIPVRADDADSVQFDNDMVLTLDEMLGGIDYLSEIGSNTAEMQRNALNQTNVVTASEVYGMGKHQKGKASQWIGYTQAHNGTTGNWA